ncbi:4-(cytidine 5'-diphospho)-2-C-methyl-D-erythritol kinase [Shimia ponticola]|uniref:4-(cytidine 5'-diphospho)-2-C-methyl-D-erythritol kinase n=1 Tax=Shimia ponticola TaxID=2582893 RepID=UPI00210381C1|nr:4-(cytidine 5'-diphospho)-2-C-methyl-D-erythritol kinase [Shimia ponticola]
MPLPKTAKAFAPAKVNLTLHVTGQREDGYHLLDSLVVFADIGDRISLTRTSDARLNVAGPMTDGVPTDASNLVWKAARMMEADNEVAILLEKHLPAAAGIGGGSSDAAATLRALARLLDRPLPTDTAQLGADVPVCMATQTTRMSGIGEVLTPVTLPALPAVLINPGVEVPTGPVFQALPSKTNAPMPEALPAFDTVIDCAAWIGTQRNDLEPPARELAPEIDTVIDELNLAPECLLARMSGSGATCFGLFPDTDTARAAATLISARNPVWWVEACVLG